ncbi:RPA family protein [Natrialbaceae archaeon A-chndr2]
MSAEEEIPGREVAYRLFAAEFDDATLSYSESDEERAPNYVITPTGARLNRVFVVGALTEVTSVNEEMLRARIVDPTGAFVVYAGQYQPEALAFLERTDPPAFVAVTGKARTYQPEDSEVVYTSIRPESLALVDADTRERWVVSAAEQTLERAGTMAAAADIAPTLDDDALEEALLEAGVERGLATGIPLALEHYGTTAAYLESIRDLALDSARVVAGERDEVRGLGRRPNGSSETAPSLASLAAELVDLDLEVDGSLEAPADAVSTGDTMGVAETSTEAPSTASQATAEAEAELEEPVATTTDDSEPSAEDTEPLAEDTEDRPSSSAETATTETPESTDDLGDFDAPGDDPVDDVTDTDSDDTLGDFDAGGADTEGAADAPATEDSEDVAAGMYEMDDEERAELEAEFGTDFATGDEVEEPGEADIDVPETETAIEDEASDTTEEAAEEEATGAADDEPTDIDDEAAETEEAEETTADVDLESLAVETMRDLDDGDGADRQAVIDAVVEEAGADADAVEEAIQDALMGGQCYEPGDETLKAI